MSVHLGVYVCIFASMCMCMHVWVHVSVHSCVCPCVCVSACFSVHVYVCVFACMFSHVCRPCVDVVFFYVSNMFGKGILFYILVIFLFIYCFTNSFSSYSYFCWHFRQGPTGIHIHVDDEVITLVLYSIIMNN